jgi:hypothetical protein
MRNLLIKVFRNSGRPNYLVESFSSYEEACDELDRITSGNSILQEEYVILEGESFEDVTYTSESGFIYFK